MIVNLLKCYVPKNKMTSQDLSLNSTLTRLAMTPVLRYRLRNKIVLHDIINGRIFYYFEFNFYFSRQLGLTLVQSR